MSHHYDGFMISVPIYDIMISIAIIEAKHFWGEASQQ
jgi:hypothetical protein